MTKPQNAIRILYLTIFLAVIVIAEPANAQVVSGGVSIPPTSFRHELMLLVIGAVLGGFLGPLLQILDGWIGISPGVRQQKANYQIQREIEAHLAVLVKQTAANAKPNEPTNSTIQKEGNALL